MKVVCISDTHNRHEQIKIPDCDLLLHTGDFTVKGTETELENFANWIALQPAEHKVVIAGNHDFICQKNPKLVFAIFQKLGIEYLNNSSVTIDGVKIYGSPWQPWFHNWAFNFAKNDDGTQALACWNKIPDDVDIVMTHGPPYKILDKVNFPNFGEDPNVGCKFLLHRIMQIQPKIHMFGHIHEQYGTFDLNGTKFVNASTCDLRYKPNNEPVVIEL